MLARRRQNIETSSLSSGWQANVGPTSTQCRQNLPTMQPTANVGPTAECYLGVNCEEVLILLPFKYYWHSTSECPIYQ